MPNDPKETVVDTSKLLIKQPQNTQASQLQNTKIDNVQKKNIVKPLITSLNEGYNPLLGHEISSKNKMVGRENFEKKNSTDDNK